MGREGKGAGGKIFRDLAAGCKPFFARRGLRWWERIFQGAGGILGMYNRIHMEELFSGWARLGGLLRTKIFQGE